VRLWLLRHAKSSWSDERLPDHDRPLARRGELAADRMSEYLAAEVIRPQLVLCSSALRARQTLARVLPGLGDELEVRVEPDMYTFDGSGLLERIRRLPEELSSAMLIGHNPSIQHFASNLAGSGPRLDDLRAKFPTGALAEIELPAATWAETAGFTGELTRFVVPKELA
jgi:phosphohistidine phosphatase